MAYSPQNSTFPTLDFFLLPRLYHFRTVQTFSGYADQPQFTARQRLSYLRAEVGIMVSIMRVYYFAPILWGLTENQHDTDATHMF